MNGPRVSRHFNGQLGVDTSFDKKYGSLLPAYEIHERLLIVAQTIAMKSTDSRKNSAAKAKSAASPSDRQFVASLAHGLDVLQVLASEGHEMTLSAVSRTVGRSKASVWRLLHTLVKLGYVQQNPDTRRFAVAPRVLSLGVCFAGMDLKELAGPLLRQLSMRIGETVNMAVADDDQLIYIERIKTSQIININLHVGSRLPLYNTSLGRVLLAHKSDAQIREYIAKLESDRDANTRKYVQKSGAMLLDILQQTLQQGYALNDEDFALGLRSAACPVWGADHRVVAAINIAVPSARVSIRELRTQYLPQLLRTADEISGALGHRRPQRSVTADGYTMDPHFEPRPPRRRRLPRMRPFEEIERV